MSFGLEIFYYPIRMGFVTSPRERNQPGFSTASDKDAVRRFVHGSNLNGYE